MRGSGHGEGGRRGRRGAGFTLVEIMVTLVVTVTVVAGIYKMFTTLHAWWITSGAKSEMRQSARIGIETLTRDLEMAGYQKTNYGDTNKANLSITLAATGEIEMDQQRLDIDSGTYEPRLVYYHVATDATTGRRHLFRQIRSEPGLASPDELVAENVSAFTLSYFTATNAPVAADPPLVYLPGAPAPAALASIRRVDVTLTTVPGRTNLPIRQIGPGGQTTPSYTLTASVMPPNLAVAESTGDVTPPAVPTGLAVVDNRSCGAKLQARWSASAELDLAGYVVFYGATAKRVFPLSGLADRNNPQVTLNPADLLVTKLADAGTPNTYAIEVAAYDSSGNYSGRSAPVTGNPAPSVGTFGGGNDTTVNPARPLPPAGVSVVPGGDFELVVTWLPPADGSATVGYRLYRSTSAFVDGAHVDDALEIAGEGTLGAGATSYTDTGLDGCVTYYYAVASVNCDETLVPTYVHRTSGATDYAVASAAPTDTTPPPPPSLAGSRAGWQRAFLTLKNPTASESADFVRSELWFSTAPEPAPVLDQETGVVTGGRRIPDSDSGSPGAFVTRGSQVVVFDSETQANPPEPVLINEGVYHVLAVGYDRCGNASTPDAQAIVLISLCGDDPPGPPPESPINAVLSSCEADGVTLAWEYPPKDYTGAGQVFDFAGYRVERTGPASFPTVELTAGPTWAESWTDGGPLAAGGTYTYSIRATDCVYENQNALYPANISLPLVTGPFHPGRIVKYEDPGDIYDPANFVRTDSDAGHPFTYHNNVLFNLRNTSAGTMTLKRLAVTWDNPNVVLDAIVIGGGASLTPERTIAAGGAISGAPVTTDVRIDDRALGLGAPSGPIPVRLRFVTPSGVVNRLADMRSETLALDLWVQNDSLAALECPAPGSVEIEVPRGPVLGGFSQDKPGVFGVASHEVVGQTGTARDTDIRVPNGSPVNVYGTAFDNSRDVYADGVNRGFATLKVVSIAADAAATGTTPLMPASGTFTERPFQGLGGNRYAIFNPASGAGLNLPLAEAQAVWYYGLAVDYTGNWDRVPNPDFGDYAYYQAAPNPCASAPTPPSLDGTSSASAATLTWIPPTTYANGGEIPPGDSLAYDLYYRHDEGEPDILIAENLTGTSYSFAADLLNGAYYFAVRAKNSCTPTPLVSGISNVWRECEGAAGVYCSLFTINGSASMTVAGTLGAPLALAADSVCAYRTNGSTDTATFRATGALATKDFAAAESGDSGSFARTITPVESGGAGADEILAEPGTLAVEFVTADGVSRCTKTVALAGGGCADTPRAPVLGSVRRPNTSSKNYTVDWTPPTQNADGSPLTDLAGYRLLFSSSRGLPSPPYDSSNSIDGITGSGPQTFTLPMAGRHYFWIQAYDTCSPPNYSGVSNRVRSNR